MKKITLFYLETCPYCKNAYKAMKELIKENPLYGEIEVERVEESRNPELTEGYDYYYVPTMFLGTRKMYEAHPGESYEQCRENVRRVLDGALEA